LPANDGTITGVGNWGTGAYGPELATNSSDLISVPVAAIGTTYPRWVQLLTLNATVSLSAMFAVHGGGGYWQALLNLFADLSLYMDDGLGTVVRVDVTDSAVNDGAYHVWTFVSNSASDHKVYRDGVQKGSSSSTVALNAGATTISIGGRAGALSYFGTTAAAAGGHGSVPADIPAFADDWLSGAFSAVREPAPPLIFLPRKGIRSGGLL
jgi:hypothetical protein